MWTTLFWKDTGERVISTAAQSAVGVLTADGIVGLVDVDFAGGASIVGLAALLSLLKAIAAQYKSSEVSPASLIK